MKHHSSSTDEYIIRNSIFRVGVVVAVDGQTVSIKVDKGKNTSSVLYKGDIIQNISVGGYIKIKKGFSEMIGKIEGEYITEEKGYLKNEYKNIGDKINRILKIKILGYVEDGAFKRGIKELPLIDNQCFLLSKEEFDEIHKFTKKDDEPIEIGKLEYDDGQIIEIGINSLFASHIGIFGNTGSGKSHTLAKIYRELFLKYKDIKKFTEKANFFLVDFNGEYIGDDVIIEKKYKNIYNLSTRTTDGGTKFPVDKETLQESSFWAIFLEATEKMQAPFLDRALKDKYIDSSLSSTADFKKLLQEKIIKATSLNGKNVERSVSLDLLYELSNYLGNESIRLVANYFNDNLHGGNDKISFYLGEQISENYSGCTGFLQKVQTQIDSISDISIEDITYIKKIGLRIIFKYYDEMIRGFSNREHLSGAIKRLEKRVIDLEKVIIPSGHKKEDKNLTIICLKDVNIGIRKMIPLLLSKELYEKKKKDNNKDNSLHIIIDEAHNILSGDSNRESQQWKDYRLETFEEIIKEGRKYGTFLTISSQRPSDISATIISQLHNYFLHRLINNNDLLAVEKTISYLDKVSADSIPNLGTGTCILAGLLAQIPVVVKIDQIDIKNQPESQTINLLEKWK
ncbi:ATP-binding protein [Candidatus Gracilibacteria bacterium]|nr:ATP-binding protein [Candidatus Gracilibacteria bacterium]